MFGQLSDVARDELVLAARRAAEASLSPYSRFAVGAALLCEDGTIFVGCNVESASYGLTICAERNALHSGVAGGRREFVALAVTCPDGDSSVPNSVMPCGACRQVMVDVMADDAVIIVDGVGDFTLEELLPIPFKLEAG